jgi:hypothetical protein
VKVAGYDADLYGLVGPFVMNPDVLRLNDWYPFRNTEDDRWYIAVRGRNLVTGFLSVCEGHIRNDFTWQDPAVLERLLEEVLADADAGVALSFLAEETEVPLLEKLGFAESRRTRRYAKMERPACARPETTEGHG